MRIIGLHQRISTLHFIIATPKSFIPYTQSNNEYALFPQEIHLINGNVTPASLNHYTELTILLQLVLAVVTLNWWHWYIWLPTVVTLNKRFNTPASINSYTIFKVLVQLILSRVTLNVRVNTPNFRNNYSSSIILIQLI